MTSELVQASYNDLQEMELWINMIADVELKNKLINWKNTFTDVTLRLNGFEDRK